MNDDSRYMAPLQLAGRLIMECGGETYRVEETITRMGNAFGLREVESFAVPSGLFISYRGEDGDIRTAVKRVRKGATDLNRVNAVNAVSRQVVAEELSCEEALRRLEEIADRKPTISQPLLMLAAAVSSGGWAVLFGGRGWDFACGVAVGALVQLVALLLNRYHMQTLVSTLLGSFIAALVPMVFHQLTGLGTVDVIVAGTLMPMLPGLAMTNAVQDTMRGDMVSGLSHGVNAVLTAVLVAGGALMAASLFSLLTGGAAL